MDNNDEATQPTQGAYDPRRMGRNNSGLSDADVSDVVCILHPCSPGAYKIVAKTAERAPQNVLQNHEFEAWQDNLTQRDIEEQETFIINDSVGKAQDLALRFSARTVNPAMGFIFGRNQLQCDIVLDTDTVKRVSNVHFRIYMTDQGVLMLHDMSTNGTLVDGILLRGKNANSPQTRMLTAGSIIQILSPKEEEVVKFIVRIPNREGYQEEYEQKFNDYMEKVEGAVTQGNNQQVSAAVERPGPTHRKTHIGSVKVPLVHNQFGMHWSGGDQYNVVGQIGKGAFATVYQLATKRDGRLFAAKELEKRKFMKNGILDRKLDNEMQIMKAISHPNIVQYVAYQDVGNHIYIIMEFVPCGDLQQYLTANGALSEPLGKLMAEQVFEAMAYLHKNKITHRDIKPDNILLADLDHSSFTIKLSDFGLSKVVKDEDTFLKTFCGTLLYCAPEVFPHYNAHVAGKGNKRPRRSNGKQASRFHSYSQSVDIWSFGAVLWFSLCCKPPFEGVADNTGRGMFDKIMLTPLDPGDLVKQGVSDQAVALLAEMLNTDPAARPTPAQCLQHVWFGRKREAMVDEADATLGAIAEEDEIDVEDGPDFSGLSLDERENGGDSQNSEVSIHSGSMDFFDPRRSKRVKSMHHAYRDQENLIGSSPELFHQSIPIALQPQANSPTAPMQSQPRRKLFGEISLSALAASTAYGARARDNHSEAAQGNEVSQDGDDEELTAHEKMLKAALASPSLLGAESLVRDLNMDSPQSGSSQNAGSDGPAEPKTPDASIAPQRSMGSSGGLPAHLDITPRPAPQAKFSRKIEMPITESFFYKPNDPSTHNSEYASNISGYDFKTTPSFFMNGSQNLPSTAGTSAAAGEAGDADDTDHEDDDEVPQFHMSQEQLRPRPSNPPQRQAQTQPPPTLSPAMPALPAFAKPAPRLGRLTSTPDSFTPITLNLSSRVSSWGRQDNCTHIYPHRGDTRVPKRGLILMFEPPANSKPIDLAKLEQDPDWPKQIPGLECVVATESRVGIWVNGVHLRHEDGNGRKVYGKVRSGDVIEVHRVRAGSGGSQGLKFVCEFHHGLAQVPREEGERFVLEYGRGTRDTGKEGVGNGVGTAGKKENERTKACGGDETSAAA